MTQPRIKQHGRPEKRRCSCMNPGKVCVALCGCDPRLPLLTLAWGVPGAKLADLEEMALAVIECFRAYGSIAISTDTQSRVIGGVQAILFDSSTSTIRGVVLWRRERDVCARSPPLSQSPC